MKLKSVKYENKKEYYGKTFGIKPIKQIPIKKESHLLPKGAGNAK